MYTTLQIATPPPAEPVALALAKKHARIDHADDDTLIPGYITTARVLAESFLGRALITQTLVWTVMRNPEHGWPRGGWGGPIVARPHHHAFELPRAPVQSLGSVVLTDSLGNQAVVQTADISADLVLEPARVRLNWTAVNAYAGITLPLQHLQFTFTAGYDADGTTVPAEIKQAILLMTAFLYERRGDDGGEKPAWFESLLWPKRVFFFGT